jgi:hypothetical protein
MSYDLHVGRFERQFERLHLLNYEVLIVARESLNFSVQLNSSIHKVIHYKVI